MGKTLKATLKTLKAEVFDIARTQSGLQESHARLERERLTRIKTINDLEARLRKNEQTRKDIHHT